MFDVITAEQRSPAWHLARSGRLTGSRAKDMLATVKSGEAAKRRDLRLQLVLERLTGSPQEDGYINAEMQRGIDKEPAAFDAYEARTGLFAERTGFLSHRKLMAGCSLDGHIGQFEGILELKCPKSATHLEYVRSGSIPTEHLPQLLHNLWISGAAWCDFLSFDDRFPPELQVFYLRVPRDERAIVEYERKAIAFLAEVQAEYDAVADLAAKAVA